MGHVPIDIGGFDPMGLGAYPMGGFVSMYPTREHTKAVITFPAYARHFFYTFFNPTFIPRILKRTYPKT